MEDVRKQLVKLHVDAAFPSRDDVAASLGSKDRVTRPIMTKYEYTALLAKRVQMLEHGARPLTDGDAAVPRDSTQYLSSLAQKEIREKKLPIIIARDLPTGAVEYWSAQELETGV
jgi:DNA-directed RNA polymerase I, II, and III subunit RPABC2